MVLVGENVLQPLYSALFKSDNCIPSISATFVSRQSVQQLYPVDQCNIAVSLVHYMELQDVRHLYDLASVWCTIQYIAV